jgi:hypothetical protein
LLYFCLFTSDVSGNQQLPANAAKTSFEIENDILHVSWTDNVGIRYSKKDKLANWNNRIVQPTPASGSFSSRTSLAINSTGYAAVSYQLVDGSNSYMRFKADAATNGFGTERTPSSWTDTTILAGLFNDIVFNSSNTLLTTHICKNTETDPVTGGDYDVSSLCRSTGNTASSSTPIFSQTTAGEFRDVSYSIDSNNTDFAIAASYNGLWSVNMSNSTSVALTKPANCTEAAYVSSMSNAANNLGVAVACVMSDTSCKVHFASFAFNSSGISPTWQTIGTIMNSSCSLGVLVQGDRPSVVYDRINLKWSTAWMNRSSNQLMRWSQEIPTATSSTQTEVVASDSSISGPSIAVDSTGKSYIVYIQGDAVRLITNNARPDADRTGGWNTFLQTSGQAEIVSGTGVTGVGNIGINGMKGRSNVTGQ